MPPNNTDKQPGIEDMLRGLIYSHNRANGNTAELHQASATVQALVELLVAAHARPIRMAHLFQATRREYQKMGRTLVGVRVQWG